MSRLRIIFLFISGLLFSSYANSAQDVRLEVRLSDLKKVEVCLPSTKKCKSIEMPASVDELYNVINGDFIPSARLSWITVGPRSAHLCTLRGAKAEVICARISLRMTEVVLAKKDNGNGETKLVVYGKYKRAKTAAIASSIQDSLTRARIFLGMNLTGKMKTVFTRHREMVSSTSEGVQTTMSLAAGGDGGCGYDDFLEEWTCDGSSGGDDPAPPPEGGAMAARSPFHQCQFHRRLSRRIQS